MDLTQTPGGEPSSPLQPSIITTLIMSILAFLGGGAGVVNAVALFSLKSEVVSNGAHGWFPGWLIASGVIYLLLAATLVVGGLFALLRRRLGPLLVAIACGAYIVLGIAGIVIAAMRTSDLNSQLGTHVDPVTPMAIIRLLFPLATLILALIAPTRRYCTR